MNLETTIDKPKAIKIILIILITVISVGILIGKAFFWEKFDTRSSEEKNLEKYQREVLLNPENPTARINLGWAYYKLELFTEAEKEYREALKIEPQNLSANYNLATVLLNQQKFKEAELQFQRVLKRDNEHLLAYYGLGETLRQQKKYVQAEQALQKGLEIDKNAADIITQLALVYEDWGKTMSAIEYYKKALNILPNFQEAKDGLKRLGEGAYQPTLPGHNGGN